MPIDYDTTQAEEPVVREGNGWRQHTPCRQHRLRCYEDCAPADASHAAIEDHFTSMTSALRTGYPTDFSDAAVYNAVDESIANWDHLCTLHPTEPTKAEFGDDLPSRRQQMVAYRDISLRRAADRGTGTHAYIEARLRGEEIDWDYVTRMGSLPWIAAAENFLQTEQPEPVLMETVAFDRDLMVAGTVDALVRFRGALWECDWKGLALDTPLPTPSGWTTMRDVQEGDFVLGSDGAPCKVVGKSQVHYRDCYRIHFNDKTSIVCDNEHLWEVVGDRGEVKTLTTVDLALNTKNQRGGSQWRVNNTAPLDLPPADLPVHPYVLGAWLGDGCTRRGEISKPDQRLWKEIEGCGYACTPGEDRLTRTVYGLVTELRFLGVLDDKHVPAIYLRGSREQRLALLQGLMDTDGTWNPLRGQAIFTNTNERLADAVSELVVSLGWRANKWTQIAHGFGVSVREWRIAFTPFGVKPFRSRAGDCDLSDRTMSKRRVIQEVERIPTVPTQCIAVDSADSLYLCGRQMVPTHNTRTQKEKRYWTHDRRGKEAAQLGGYHRMLTQGYYMDDRGRRQRITETLTVAVVTFGADGTYAIHEVDPVAAEDAYDTAMAMRERTKISFLMPAKPDYSGDFDPNPRLSEVIANVPDDAPEKMVLNAEWIKAGFGRPSKGEVEPGRFGEAMALIYAHTAKYQPFATDTTAPPETMVDVTVAEDLARRLRELPADLADEARRNATGLPALSSIALTQSDAEDWDRVLALAETAHRSRQQEAVGVFNMARQVDGALALLPDDIGTWTDRDLTLATAIVSALTTNAVTPDGATAVTQGHLLDMYGSKAAVKKIAREKAGDLGIDAPSRWEDLVADPILCAVLVAT